MLTQKDLQPRPERIPNKQERKDAQRLNEQYGKNLEELKELCLPFFNEKILPLNMPMGFLEEKLPDIFKMFLVIKRCNSKEFKAFMKLQRKSQETNINALTYED